MTNLQMERPTVALQDQIDDIAKAVFEDSGFTVVEFPKGTEDGKLLEIARDAESIGGRSEGVSANVVLGLPHLQAVGAYCIGTDKYPQDAASERRIPVFNATDQTAESVAELALIQAGNLLRGIPQQNESLHSPDHNPGTWLKHAKGRTMGGKLMGVLGYGAIGQTLGVKAEGIGMRVGGFDIAERQPLGEAQMYDDLEELLATADVLSVHVPGGQAGPVVGARELALMKPDAYVINTARADSVDIEALDYATRNGVIAGAAIDVFGEDEPAKKGDPFTASVRNNPNILLTSHIAGSTVEGQQAVAEYVTGRLIDFRQSGSTKGAINDYWIAAEAQAA